MRKLSWIVLLAPALVGAQSWEKLITPGLSYRMEVDTKTPRLIHMLRWSPGVSSLFVRSEIAQLKLFSSTPENSKEEVSSLVNRTGAIAGINGDFFPASGEPLGAMVRDGQLISRPFPGRAAFGWGAGAQAMGLLTWQASISVDSLAPIPIQGWNEDLANDKIVFFTDVSTEARAAKPNQFVLVKMDTIGFTPTSKAKGRVVKILKNVDSMPIPAGHAAIAAQSENVGKLSKIKDGSYINLDMTTSGMDWLKIDNVIGGGPMLVRAGNESIDGESAGFGKQFIENRHPRTAVGRTMFGDILFVTVDGRMAVSAGATLKEMAEIMRQEGCVDAINLDGGGSTTMCVLGQILNRPSDGRERKVSNAVLFFGKIPEPLGGPLVVKGPASLTADKTAQFVAIGPDGRAIPDRRVLWSSSGVGGFVDQAGVFRGMAEGAATVTAYSQGQRATLQIKVDPAAVTTPVGPAPGGSDPTR